MYIHTNVRGYIPTTILFNNKNNNNNNTVIYNILWER